MGDGEVKYKSIFDLYMLKLFFQGNYDSFIQTRMELEENQMKRYKWEQDQIAHMKVCLLFKTMCILKMSYFCCYLQYYEQPNKQS